MARMRMVVQTEVSSTPVHCVGQCHNDIGNNKPPFGEVSCLTDFIFLEEGNGAHDLKGGQSD